jgi:hypothetical protein
MVFMLTSRSQKIPGMLLHIKSATKPGDDLPQVPSRKTWYLWRRIFLICLILRTDNEVVNPNIIATMGKKKPE